MVVVTMVVMVLVVVMTKVVVMKMVMVLIVVRQGRGGCARWYQQGQVLEVGGQTTPHAPGGTLADSAAETRPCFINCNRPADWRARAARASTRQLNRSFLEVVQEAASKGRIFELTPDHAVGPAVVQHAEPGPLFPFRVAGARGGPVGGGSAPRSSGLARSRLREGCQVRCHRTSD